MAKKPYKCKVSGRVCPFDDSFFEMTDAGGAADSCPIQQYENSNHTKEDGTRVINDWCKHLVERKQENKSGKPMTNFERIKEMSVEEISGFLNDISTSLAIKLNGEYIVREKESIKQWLNSENTP